MPDPSIIPDGIAEAGKLGGSAVSGGLFTLLLGRLFGSHDKALEQVLAELKVLTASVGGLSQQLAVLAAGNARNDADVARLEQQVSEQGKAIARLEALVEQLSEGRPA